ncbi:hypothetical protein PINS_up000740 [Pythium insidiosum]|nr:hypothetical protein PINS_up000740 [Pythium insidiosum]
MLARVNRVAALLLLALVPCPGASTPSNLLTNDPIHPPEPSPIPDPVPEPPVPGGFTSVTVQEADTDRLKKVLQSSASYVTDSPLRLCYVDVLGLWAQVVAGFNYDYDILACVVSVAENGQGKCASACAAPSRYLVRVFEQEWTDTLQIESILELLPSPDPVPLPLPMPDPPIPDPVPEPPVPGGFTSVTVQEADTDRLKKVLQSSASYVTDSPLRLCYVDVLGLWAQVVAGFNYDYDILACVVSVAENGQGKCASACAAPSRYLVRVFEQEWTDTLQIESILELLPSPDPVPLPLPMPDPPIPDPVPEPPVPGGFTSVTVQEADTDRLKKVLQSSASYVTDSPLRLCYVDVLGLGMNVSGSMSPTTNRVVVSFVYVYDLEGCIVPTAEAGLGACAADCNRRRLSVSVLEVPSTGYLKVPSIEG